ncbi:MAG: hypothetical protein JRI70_09505 [Deltaproteobacteria bacterium]|nr:hypothetical protein [Deltaproteobacteria bacterium]
MVKDQAYFQRLVLYIHYNPQKHGLIDDYALWPFSSYTGLLSTQPTRLNRDEVIATFGDRDNFEALHLEYKPGEDEEEF